ncbi:hypothetical protein [Crocinitomix catalasitica]|uniref:hypothetical protein n=1 Tax=Crocinitomix catalasitica TaxID=184607 RepID=UPI0004846105|nr:hypothetical protein [Crocinitomix catalasitica]
MTLEKVQKHTFFQRFKNIVLGKTRPNILTRLSVIAGFAVWIYLISWHILTLISLVLVGNLKNGGYVKAAYENIGFKQYFYFDTYQQLTIYTLAEILILFISLIGLVLIWRKKRIGFICYMLAQVALILTAYLYMGARFFELEFGYFDLILIASTILYFLIGLFIFHRKNVNI